MTCQRTPPRRIATLIPTLWATCLICWGPCAIAATIQNGDFSLGDTDFTTEYIARDCKLDASYNLLYNPSSCRKLPLKTDS